MNNVSAFSPADELTYLNYSRAIRNGLSGYHDVVRYMLDTPAAWPYPSPSRWAAFLVDGLACRIAEPCDFRTLTLVSTVSGIVLIPVVYAVGRRLLTRTAALAGTALMVTSPLLLGLGRRALQDEFFVLMVWLAFWLVIRVLERPPRARDHILAILALGLAFGAKDTFIIFDAAFAAMFLTRPRRPLAWWDLALVIGPLIVWVSGFVLVAGGPGDLVALEKLVLGYRTNPDSYERIYAGGPLYQPIVDFLVLSPLVTIMAIAGLVAAFARPSSPNVRRLAWVTVACFVAFGILPKDIRYAAAVAPMLALMAGSVLTTLQLRPRALAVAALPIALAANAALEGWIFWMIFIIADVYDPVLVNLLRALHAIP